MNAWYQVVVDDCKETCRRELGAAEFQARVTIADGDGNRRLFSLASRGTSSEFEIYAIPPDELEVIAGGGVRDELSGASEAERESARRHLHNLLSAVIRGSLKQEDFYLGRLKVGRRLHIPTPEGGEVTVTNDFPSERLATRRVTTTFSPHGKGLGGELGR